MNKEKIPSSRIYSTKFYNSAERVARVARYGEPRSSRVQGARSSRCKRVETSRGNLIERSKPRCVQFASINVSSLAAGASVRNDDGRRGGGDERSDEGRKGREVDEGEGAGGDVIRTRGDEPSLGMTTGHERPPSSFNRAILFKAHLCPSPLQQLQTSFLPTPSSPLRPRPARRSNLIGMEAKASTYNVHLHSRRPREEGVCRNRHPPSRLSGPSPPSISRLPSDRSMP